MINILPAEMQAYVFSFLNSKDLVNTSLVSHDWKEVQEIDILWKRHCLDLLEHEEDDIQPLKDSWKEHYKMLNNWKNDRSEKKSYTLFKNEDYGCGFTILKDNTPLEIYFDNSLSTYCILNFSNEEITQIDYLKHNEHIISSTIYDKTWIVLTEQGKILFFDLLTGQYLKEIAPKEIAPSDDALQISSGSIICDGQDVITAYNNVIKIYDSITDVLKQTINTPNLGRTASLYSTQNFIIFKSYDSGIVEVFSIRKSDGKISQIENPHTCFRATGSGSYCALHYSDGKINILEDTGEGLNLIHTLEAPSNENGSYCGYDFIHKNFLLVGKNDKVTVYNMKTGNEFTTIKYHEKGTTFCANVTRIFMRTYMYGYFRNDQYKYTLYNFEDPDTNLNQPSAQWCTIL